MRNVKPLVLIGNGPSIRGFDFSRLRGMDTMAMNAFYKVSNETGFFPTYYCLFRKYMEWGDEPSDFIIHNHDKMRACFYVKRLQDGCEGYPELEGIDGVVPIIRREASFTPTEKFKDFGFAEMYDDDIEKCFSIIKEKLGAKKFAEFLETKIDDPPYELSVSGMVKWYLEKDKAKFFKKDLEPRYRWEQAYEWVESLDDFCSSGEPSGVECVRIAYLLGYNVILMIGFDGNFKLDKDGNVLPESWGITEPFNGFPYNAYEHTHCMSCKTEEGIRDLQNMFWAKFMTSIDINGKNLVLYNCTENSDLSVIPYSPFDKAFSKMMSLTTSPSD